MDAMNPVRQERGITMYMLKFVMAVVVLSAVRDVGAVAAESFPPPTSIRLSTKVLTITESLQPATVTVDGPCVTSGCTGGAQGEPDRVLARVTVTPRAGAQAALNIDRVSQGNEDSSWATGFVAAPIRDESGAVPLPVKVLLPGGTLPAGPDDWWVADGPGQPRTWEIRLAHQDWVVPGTYELMLLGGSYTN